VSAFGSNRSEKWPTVFREVHEPIVEGPFCDVVGGPKPEGEVGWPAGLERCRNLFRKLLHGMEDELDLAAGLLLECGNDLSDCLVLLGVVALLPPDEEISGPGAERRQNERGGENYGFSTHVELASVRLEVVLLTTRGNDPHQVGARPRTRAGFAVACSMRDVNDERPQRRQARRDHARPRATAQARRESRAPNLRSRLWVAPRAARAVGGLHHAVNRRMVGLWEPVAIVRGRRVVVGMDTKTVC
jgi:hypothetical protein